MVYNSLREKDIFLLKYEKYISIVLFYGNFYNEKDIENIWKCLISRCTVIVFIKWMAIKSFLVVINSCMFMVQFNSHLS